MDDEDKTKEQPLSKPAALRRRAAELKNNVVDCRAAEETPNRAEERFRSLFDAAGDGLLLAHKETRKFVMGNSAILRMLGYTADELNRIGVADIHPEQSVPWVIDRFEALARKEIEIALDIPVRRKDGSVFYGSSGK